MLSRDDLTPAEQLTVKARMADPHKTTLRSELRKVLAGNGTPEENQEMARRLTRLFERVRAIEAHVDVEAGETENAEE